MEPSAYVFGDQAAGEQRGPALAESREGADQSRLTPAVRGVNLLLMPAPVVQIGRLTHRYGQRVAVDELSLEVQAGEIFGFLGPNGSGKTTLFRILSTLLPAQSGTVRIFDHDLNDSRDAIRRAIGVVFQSPSLDKQLTAMENLICQGHLYGLRGKELAERAEVLLNRVGLLDRRNERVGGFSGGMRRRVELAKGLLHQPKLLLLDEPSTGLDPAARIDLWQLLSEINQHDGVTVLLTTHLMDEADRCSRLAILGNGKLLACDAPSALKARLGGQIVTITTPDAPGLSQRLQQQLGVESALFENGLRFERPDAHALIGPIVEAAGGLIQSISLGQPTLEDVFIHLTGHRLAGERADAAHGERTYSSA